MKRLWLVMSLFAVNAAFASQQIVEHHADGAEAKQYAQLCIKNSTARRVHVATKWNIGDKAHHVILGSGVNMVYRLVSDTVNKDAAFQVNFNAAVGGMPKLAKELVEAKWSETATTNCEELPQYEFVSVTKEGECLIQLVQVAKP